MQSQDSTSIEGVCQKCGNDNAMTTPCKHAKPKPKTFKLVEGKLVEMMPDEVVPPNRAERRRVSRIIRANMRKLTRKKPKPKPKPGAKKWNHAARRHLERYVNAMERRAEAMKKALEEKAA